MSKMQKATKRRVYWVDRLTGETSWSDPDRDKTADAEAQKDKWARWMMNEGHSVLPALPQLAQVTQRVPGEPTLSQPPQPQAQQRQQITTTQELAVVASVEEKQTDKAKRHAEEQTGRRTQAPQQQAKQQQQPQEPIQAREPPVVVVHTPRSNDQLAQPSDDDDDADLKVLLTAEVAEAAGALSLAHGGSQHYTKRVL